MSTVQTIITRVRDTLADPNGDRWDDDRLLRLVDEAQKDICRRAKLLRTKAEVGIYDNQGTYILPDDMLLLDRILLNGELLPLKSHGDLDKTYGDNWEEATGTPICAIYDKQNRQRIKLYPIPTDLGADEYTFSNPGYFEDIDYVLDNFGIIVDVPIGDSLSPDYGVTADVDYIDYLFNTCNTGCDPYTLLDADINSDYGVVTNWTTELKDTGVHDEQFGVVVGIEGLTQNSDYGVLIDLNSDDIQVENFASGVYGVTVDISETSDSLTVYYLKNPDDITSLDDVLEIDSIFNAAIKYYVVGKALRDDMDTQNRVVGNEELDFYARELTEAISDDEQDFTRNDIQYNTEYRSI